MKKTVVYKPPRFMSVAEAADQLLQIVARKRTEGVAEADLAYTESSLCVGVARVGHDSQRIWVGKLSEMAALDLGGPLHSMVLPSRDLHPLEVEYLQLFATELLTESS